MLKRKDIRAKLDADRHAQLRAICEIDGIDMGEFVEAVLLPVIERRVHAAIELAGRLQRSGITGNEKRKPGITGNTRE